MNWQPISEEPVESGFYLGYLKSQKTLSIMIVYWNGEHWNYTRHLTHWMPLPQPPQAQE